MKHNPKVIFVILFLFLLSQFVGLYITYQSIGKKELALGLEKPELKKETSFAYIFILIIFVTIIALIIAKLNAIKLWKIWFFISIVVVLTVSLSFLIGQTIALILSLIAAYFKVIKPNLVIHNASEVFLYAGLSVIFAETLTIATVSILIILISIYDMYAVWKSKHMIKLAKFQTKTKIFTGLLIPYKENKKERVAILGGGDIGFPLLFASVVMIKFGVISIVVPIMVAASLSLLLYFGEKNKFYPAMPFLGAGCFLGYGLILVANTLT